MDVLNLRGWRCSVCTDHTSTVVQGAVSPSTGFLAAASSCFWLVPIMLGVRRPLQGCWPFPAMSQLDETPRHISCSQHIPTPNLQECAASIWCRGASQRLKQFLLCPRHCNWCSDCTNFFPCAACNLPSHPRVHQIPHSIPSHLSLHQLSLLARDVFSL